MSPGENYATAKPDWSEWESELPYNKCRSCTFSSGALSVYQVYAYGAYPCRIFKAIWRNKQYTPCATIAIHAQMARSNGALSVQQVDVCIPLPHI